MKRSTAKATVAALAVAGLTLAGCASGSRGGGNNAEGLDLIQTTPAPKGEVDKVVWDSTYGELASLDPIKAFNYPENTVVANLCEALFQIQPDFSVKPNLAKEANTEDGKKWVIDLRDDVTFWDGAPMTPEDVIFSINRHNDAQEGSYWTGDVTANIASVEQTGDNQITINLTNADYLFDSQLSTIVGTVVQKAQREAAGENYGNPGTGVMCTGPFKYEAGNWKQGQSITLDKNPDYWNAEKAAKANQVEIQFVVDPNAISTGLSSGELQGSYDVPTQALGNLSNSDSGQLFYGEGMQNMAIIPTGTGAFADPTVRRAVTLATDRQAIADTVYESTGEVSRSLVPQAPWDAIDGVSEARDEALPDLSFDIEKAKEEIQKTDADLSQPIKIAYPSERSFYADILNEMARGAKEIGVTLEPTGIPSAQFGAFFSDEAAREGYDGFVTTNYLSSPDPLQYLNSIAKTDADQNYAGFSNAEVDAALEAAQGESDPQKRAELTAKAEGLIMEYQPWVPIVDLAVRLYMSNEITGAPASFVYLYYPWAADIGSAE